MLLFIVHACVAIYSMHDVYLLPDLVRRGSEV